MYKVDLALNNLQWLICHKTQPIFQDQLLYQGLVEVYPTIYP